MTSYLILKWLHVSLALTSGAGFVFRAGAMLCQSPILSARWIRVAPHVIDTFLLATGVTLAVRLQASPLDNPWLAVKLVAIAGYIVLGAVALRAGRTRGWRRAAAVAAVAVFCYILSVARARSPLPFL